MSLQDNKSSNTKSFLSNGNGLDTQPTALDILKSRSQWVVWKRWADPKTNKITKPPYSYKTGNKCDAHDPDNQTDYETAAAAAKRLGMDGVGYALSDDDNITGIDLDHCINPFDELEPWAQEIIDLGETYAERSPSDCGVRLFAFGKVPHATKNNYAGVEIYGTKRYLTFTGNHIPGTPNTINPAPATLKKLIQRATTIKDPNQQQDPTPSLSERAKAKAPPQPKTNASDTVSPWRRINDAAFANLSAWVPKLFPTAVFQPGTKAYRISSGDLGRDLEEDISIAPSGAVDFGLHDMGDNRQGKRTAIDLVMLFLSDDVISEIKAAEWLCAQLGVSLQDMGFNASESFSSQDNSYSSASSPLPDPEPIGVSLLPVPPFNPELLPEAFRDWVSDIAYRMQCPIDYVAVAIMVSAGSVIGRKITIKPSKAGDWVVVPNLWGMIVGRPGVMKTPALEAAMSSLDMLEAQAREKNIFAKDKYAKDKKNADIHNKNLENLAKEAHKKALEKNKDARINTEGNYITVTEPVDKRYIVTDATYEKLGIIVSQNTDGVLYYRDELPSLLRDLAKEENVSARGFFLQAWNGNSPYTFDRVTRESVFIPAVCVSVLGTTQPGPLAEFIHNNAGSTHDDGLPQRFNMLIWPDCNEPFVERDVAVNKEARTRAHDTFKYLDTLTGDDVDAEMETFDKTPWLAFDDDAYALFSTWRVNLENRLRGSKIKNTALESHLAKYRKLVPALSLILHIVDGGKGPIPQATLTKAIAWAEYLEAHAARTYESEGAAEVATAKSIIERIKKGELTGEFKVRTIVRRGWSGLKNTKMVRAAVDYLEDAKWIIHQQRKSPGPQGGRGSDTTYTINPKALTASVD